MSEEKKKRNKIIGISIGILVVLLVVISSTYAYWQITKSQDDPNKIIAACLDFDVDFPVGITEENKWPMSSSEAMNTIDGYTFTVTNNCPEDVTYVVGLESVTSDNIASYLSDASVGIGFDGVNKGTYSSLTDLEGPTMDARGSKKLQTAVVKGKSEVEGENVNTHNLKIWIDESSPVEEQGRGFAAKLFITGGQEIENDNPNILTAESCFEITEEGEIIDYDESCGSSAVIPATVNGVAVKTIDSNAFKYKAVVSKYSLDGKAIDSIDMTNVNFALVPGEEGPLYAITYTTDEEVLLGIKELLTTELGLTEENIYASTDENIPTLKEGEFKVYVNFISQENFTVIGTETLEEDTILSINSLDLSQTHFLELIEPGAFSIVDLTEKTSSYGCTYLAYDVTQNPKGLKNLKFGNQNEIQIGTAAFAGLDVEELTLYTNIKEKRYCSDYEGCIFANSNINILNINSLQNNTVFNPNFDNSFSLVSSNVHTVNINEGITEIGIGALGLVYTTNISLPNSLKKIGATAFAGPADMSEEMNITIPYNVTYIDSHAFQNRYGTVTFLRTEEDVKTNVTLDPTWEGNMTVIYAE